MITFLNDRDWQTRAAFFREVPCMAAQAGFAGMEAFLLPCVEQAHQNASPLCVHACRLYQCGVDKGPVQACAGKFASLRQELRALGR